MQRLDQVRLDRAFRRLQTKCASIHLAESGGVDIGLSQVDRPGTGRFRPRVILIRLVFKEFGHPGNVRDRIQQNFGIQGSGNFVRVVNFVVPVRFIGLAAELKELQRHEQGFHA